MRIPPSLNGESKYEYSKIDCSIRMFLAQVLPPTATNYETESLANNSVAISCNHE